MKKQDAISPVVVATRTASKLGERSSGLITYEVSVLAEQPSLSIVGNDSGGYFSKELISIRKIEDCLAASPPGKPFTVRALRQAFVGRSSNNAGFLAAALRAEGLIEEAELPRQYVQGGNWDAWQTSQLEAAKEAEPEHVFSGSGKAAKASKGSRDVSEGATRADAGATDNVACS